MSVLVGVGVMVDSGGNYVLLGVRMGVLKLVAMKVSTGMRVILEGATHAGTSVTGKVD